MEAQYIVSLTRSGLCKAIAVATSLLYGMFLSVENMCNSYSQGLVI